MLSLTKILRFVQIYYLQPFPLNPNDIPMTAKKVPAGVPEMMSTITRSPEMAHADIKPAIEQYGIKSC